MNDSIIRKRRLPLLGKHSQVDCLQCHTGGNFKKPVFLARCSIATRPNPHGGQFAKRPDKGECSSCHNVNAWKPSLDVKAHGATAYPLRGQHVQVQCTKCHVPAGAATRYEIAFAKCTDCHTDIHQGQFAGAPYKSQCEPCHTVKAFKPSTYTIAQHQKTKFPLAGGHLAVTCSECHSASKAAINSGVVPYQFNDRSCTGCHTDPHHGEFRSGWSRNVPTEHVSAARCVIQ